MLQSKAEPQCLWSTLKITTDKSNPANSLHLHWGVLMCTLQVILMSRGWFPEGKQTLTLNLLQPNILTQTPHCVNELAELISNMTKLEIRTFCSTWLSGLCPSRNVHSPPVLQSPRQGSVSDRIHKALSCRESWLPNQQRNPPEKEETGDLKHLWELITQILFWSLALPTCIWQSDWYN